jgi:hypothetical protein
MTPLLQFALGILAGAFTLIAVWIGSRLSFSREHHRWILDNKKLEWRELIDEMHACFARMVYGFQNLNVISPTDDGNDPDAGVRRGFRILRNRIFIAPAIAQHRIMEQWEELVAYVNSARQPREPHEHGGLPTFVGFNLRAAAFQDKLMEVVREDLTIPLRQRRSIFSRFRAKRLN